RAVRSAASKAVKISPTTAARRKSSRSGGGSSSRRAPITPWSVRGTSPAAPSERARATSRMNSGLPPARAIRSGSEPPACRARARRRTGEKARAPPGAQPRLRRELGPGGAQDQDRQVRAESQPVQEVHDLGLGPVQVLDPQEERPLPGEGAEVAAPAVRDLVP